MRHRLWALAFAAGLVQAAPLRSTLDDQKALAVTVYNGDLALVKDTRELTLPAGESVLEAARRQSAKTSSTCGKRHASCARPLARLCSQASSWLASATIRQAQAKTASITCSSAARSCASERSGSCSRRS